MDAEESDLTAEQAIAATNAVVDAELNALGLDPFRVAGPVSLLHERAKAAFDAVRADRDRLAKRCADLESRLAVANKAEAHSRAQVDAYHDIGATTRLGDVESRLAATDARLTALVSIVERYLGDEISGDEAAPMIAALRAPGVELRQCPECDCDPAALATARRARVGRGRK